MSKKQKQNESVKQRNIHVLEIIEKGSGGPMKNRKKEKNKKVCRERIDEVD